MHAMEQLYYYILTFSVLNIDTLLSLGFFNPCKMNVNIWLIAGVFSDLVEIRCLVGKVPGA